MSSLYNKQGYIYYSVRYLDASGKRKKTALSLRLKYNRTNLKEAKIIKNDLDNKFKSIVYRGTDITLSRSVDLFLRTKRNKNTMLTYKYELKPLLQKYKTKKVNEINFDEEMEGKSVSQRKHIKSFVLFLYRKGYIIISE